MDFLVNHVESLIFCANDPISTDDIQECLSEMFDTKVPEEDITQAIETLEKRYSDEQFSFSLVEIGGGMQFLTKPAYQASISILLKQKSKKRLSTSALETLAIIAYRQPITKLEAEQIRGVNCDYSIHKLLDKELIEIKGKAETVGKPLLYGTSQKFMEYFGINKLEELPQLKDFVTNENEIGEINDQ